MFAHPECYSNRSSTQMCSVQGVCVCVCVCVSHTEYECSSGTFFFSPPIQFLPLSCLTQFWLKHKMWLLRTSISAARRFSSRLSMCGSCQPSPGWHSALSSARPLTFPLIYRQVPHPSPSIISGSVAPVNTPAPTPPHLVMETALC